MSEPNHLAAIVGALMLRDGVKEIDFTAEQLARTNEFAVMLMRDPEKQCYTLFLLTEEEATAKKAEIALRNFRPEGVPN